MQSGSAIGAERKSDDERRTEPMNVLKLKGRSFRLGAALSAVLISCAGFLSTPCAAKHKQQLSVPSDPCPKMSSYLMKRISDMKSLKATIAKEQTVPDTLAGVFDLMQGKPYVDQPKAQKLAEMRREANNINDAMRVSGCTVVDIDTELGKPATPALPAPARKGKSNGTGLETNIPLRSSH